MPSFPSDTTLLPADTNQARGLACYAIEFLRGSPPPVSAPTFALLERFHLDSVGCGISALAAQTNAPSVLRREALGIAPAAGSTGAVCFYESLQAFVQNSFQGHST